MCPCGAKAETKFGDGAKGVYRMKSLDNLHLSLRRGYREIHWY